MFEPFLISLCEFGPKVISLVGIVIWSPLFRPFVLKFGFPCTRRVHLYHLLIWCFLPLFLRDFAGNSGYRLVNLNVWVVWTLTDHLRDPQGLFGWCSLLFSFLLLSSFFFSILCQCCEGGFGWRCFQDDSKVCAGNSEGLKMMSVYVWGADGGRKWNWREGQMPGLCGPWMPCFLGQWHQNFKQGCGTTSLIDVRQRN